MIGLVKRERPKECNACQLLPLLPCIREPLSAHSLWRPTLPPSYMKSVVFKKINNSDSCTEFRRLLDVFHTSKAVPEKGKFPAPKVRFFCPFIPQPHFYLTHKEIGAQRSLVTCASSEPVIVELGPKLSPLTPGASSFYYPLVTLLEIQLKCCQFCGRHCHIWLQWVCSCTAHEHNSLGIMWGSQHNSLGFMWGSH